VPGGLQICRVAHAVFGLFLLTWRDMLWVRLLTTVPGRESA
jgi:hypothetical protein